MANVPAKELKALQAIANRLRIQSIKATNASKSGHPTSCASMAEIMSVLFFNTMKYSLEEPRGASSDRFILSKGHAAPILYAAWAEAGLFPVEDLLNLRKPDSDLEGHPTPRLSFIDVATGSLGQGLSVAAGMAYVGKYIDKADYRVYCLVGDGESAEGSIWEAMAFSSHYKLDNLTVIFDVNRLGQSEATALGHQLDVYQARAAAFGFNAVIVDGHNIEDLVKAFEGAKTVANKPTALIARTFKGQGFEGIADKESWHGKPLGDRAEAIIAALEAQASGESLPIRAPTSKVPDVDLTVRLSEPPSYTLGEKLATRAVYGNAIVKLGKNNSRVIALDGDTKNSTFAEVYKKAFPDRFIECYIAEQNLVGVAIGAGCRGRTIPFVSTFASFFTRTFDQLRMGAISQANIKCVGSHCGVSIGEDGPSQMGLEDVAMFRTIPGAVVFYPADAVSVERACELAAQTRGITYIRTSRPATPVIYANDFKFVIGKANVVKSIGGPSGDKCLLIGAGVTLYEALNAAETLKTQNIPCRVLDLFTVKPMDTKAVIANARECGGNIVVAEEHYPEGGIGEAVAAAVAGTEIRVVRLAVKEIPRSGPAEWLIDHFGIGSRSIVEAVKSLVK